MYDPAMLGRLFTFASIASLALGLAGATLWVRSFWAGDWVFVEWDRPRAGTNGHEVIEASLRSSRGTVETVVQESRKIWGRSWYRHGSGPPRVLIFQTLRRTGTERLGFRWVQASGPVSIDGLFAPSGTRTVVDLPDWAMVVGGLILPACWLVRRVRRRRGTAGFEPFCGDLACGGRLLAMREEGDFQ